MKTYEYWEDDEGHAFFPSDCIQRDIVLGTSPRLVWTVEADSWEDAMKKRAEYLGETYKPLENK